MKIVKVLNNNTVATITNDNKEAIIQGLGIGFQKKPGDLIDEIKIEKIFIFNDGERNQFEELLKDTPIDFFKLAKDIVVKTKNDLNITLNNKILISLTDHISFALERYKQGIPLPSLMLDDIKILYPKEYEIGLWALNRINKNLNVNLDNDEAGYLTLHILNAKLNVAKDQTINIIRMCKDVMSIIEKIYDINLKEKSINYLRIITHLKYLAQKIFTKENNRFIGTDDLYDLIIKKDNNLSLCINLISDYINLNFSYDLSKDDKVYLMIHILRIIKK